LRLSGEKHLTGAGGGYVCNIHIISSKYIPISYFQIYKEVFFIPQKNVETPILLAQKFEKIIRKVKNFFRLFFENISFTEFENF